MKRTRQRATPRSRTAVRLVSPKMKTKSSEFYRIAKGGTSITCCICGHTSRDKSHIRAKFCPRCLMFHEDRILMSRLAEGYQKELPAQEEAVKRFKLAA